MHNGCLRAYSDPGRDINQADCWTDGFLAVTMASQIDGRLQSYAATCRSRISRTSEASPIE
jgi:hypothetical protein